ncbi:DNA replication/repair protein RecF [Streptococcus zalophi]|uniref:DNA replication and repair protein RecF n=1 Tax=Streptococcus zalophi TaxID=640031 RepID=A0A934PAI7_9STRE|nr:DNA replication/repair protein RecF [Streptococcus zalophi]MBJ8350077.1 DNA replication/repair protein RecF [Streptococcus zalophi]MCR8968147.1 DNA replication/repair protein RecF [Streptococcus zalophi]
MQLESLKLLNFRNYTNANLDFSPHLNVFVGKNAQGKTNLIEAIYFLSLTRSHRAKSDKELIAFSQNHLNVSGNVNRLQGKLTLDISLSDKGRITKVNHLKQSKLSDYIGHLPVVLFAPEDLQLIKGSPSLRRKFIDIDLGQIKPLYLTDLSNYNHVLKQRNSYLKTTAKIDPVFLSVLDEQLITYGSQVIRQRLSFIKKLATKANQHHLQISNQQEHLSMSYQSSVKFTDENTVEEAFRKQLKKQLDRDLFKKNTSIGPHRDDILFLINNIEANFGSQGQHRSLILSLKLAEIDLIKETINDYPILLLDDVMSELDNHRQLKLLENIHESVQTFITTTSLDHLHQIPDDIQLFLIESGGIKQKKAVH